MTPKHCTAAGYIEVASADVHCSRYHYVRVNLFPRAGTADISGPAGSMAIASAAPISRNHTPTMTGANSWHRLRIRSDWVLDVVEFSTEAGFDYLSVAGVWYSGYVGPDGELPRGTIEWRADAQHELSNTCAARLHSMNDQATEPASTEDEIYNDRGWNVCLREAWPSCGRGSLRAVIACQ